MKKLLSVIVTGLITIASAFAAKTATVKPQTLNVRIKNNTSCDVICQLKKDDKVQVISIDQQWAKIVTPEHANVFVASQYFKDGVTTNQVQLRCGAGTNYQSYGIVPAGTRLTVVKDTGKGWIQVKPLSTMASYVSAAYLILDDTPAETTQQTQKEQTTTPPKSAVVAPSTNDFVAITMSENYRKMYEDNKKFYFIKNSQIENFTAAGTMTTCNNNLFNYGLKNTKTGETYLLIGEFPKYFERQNVIVVGTNYHIKGWEKSIIVVDKIKIADK